MSPKIGNGALHRSGPKVQFAASSRINRVNQGITATTTKWTTNNHTYRYYLQVLYKQ